MEEEKILWGNARRKISELSEWEKNPRQIKAADFEKLKESITRFNFTTPVLVNLDNRLIAGHMRIRALKALGRGEEEIDVRVPSRALTEGEAEELSIRDNKNLGEWDWDLLSANFEVADLIKWGFEDWELGLQPGSATDEQTRTDSEVVYDNNPIKRLTFLLDAEQYKKVVENLQMLMTHKELTDLSSALVFLCDLMGQVDAPKDDPPLAS